MEIITSHNALDFDGLASMVAASKLYPSATRVFSGTLSKNVKRFIALYKDFLMMKMPREVDFGNVSRMIVVDTANANRLGHLSELARRESMDFHIYDHHPPAPDDLRGSMTRIDEVGAATTILVEEIIERNIPLSSFDATILALGIYEDTGSLLFTSTTPRDASVVAYLLSKGANLSIIGNFMEQPFSGPQRQLMQDLLGTARHYLIKNLDVVIAISEKGKYIPGLDIVTHRIFEMEETDVIFVIAKMDEKLNIVARSRSNNIKVNEILRPLGGKGHDKAASGIIRDKNAEEVVATIIEGLGNMVNPGLVARDIMSTPVKSVPLYISMEEAGRIMLRYGHTGMPVVDEDNMVGVISRRDVDKARMHDLGHAPVKGFMTTGVMSVTPDTPVPEIQHIMVDYDIGRLPVVDEQGRLAGIVSRTDIIRTLHGGDYPEDHEILYSGGSENENCLHLMKERLPHRIMDVLKTAGLVAESLNCSVYCVGGFVRDLYLEVPNFDVDLVVEGNGEEMARKLAERLGGKARIHERFRTGVILLPDGSKIDVATARTEYYEFPAALPKVERSSIREDLYRRDFTINTLAINLLPDHFGDLIDYFGGRKDLEEGYIRILYNLSFVEDPTRILRAIRFEQRYQFQIETDTLRFARDAIERHLLGKLSYKRILTELILILNEKDPGPALDRLKEVGVWQYVLPEVQLEHLNRVTLKRIPVVSVWLEERYYPVTIKTWLIYITVLLARLSEDKVAGIIERYHFDAYSSRSIRESRSVPMMADRLMKNPRMPMTEIDRVIKAWTRENIVYLLLLVREEEPWEQLVHYLDLKDRVEVKINGNDLKQLGLKPGPAFSRILEELYALEISETIQTRKEELAMVRKWIDEGRF